MREFGIWDLEIINPKSEIFSPQSEMLVSEILVLALVEVVAEFRQTLIVNFTELLSHDVMLRNAREEKMKEI